MRLIVSALIGFLASLVVSQAVSAQNSRPAAPITAPTGPLIPQLMGRWDLVFRSPQANLDTVWVGEPSAQGSTSLGTVGNNPVGLAVTDARMSDGVVTLSGTTTLGALSITGRLSDDRIAGTFSAGPVRGEF